MKKLAALIYTSIHIPGDERSRTNPGHGYPAHDVEQISIQEFKDAKEMTAWVKKETDGRYGPTRFKLIRYEELSYTKDISIKIE
jgi:hypothetical protein